jgi:thioredoxin reductase (NADPH)
MSKFAKEVNIVIRREGLSQVAANYLVENIARTPNIHVLASTDVIACAGSSMLENITLRNALTQEQRTVPAKALFVYIGTRPGTGWINNILLLDAKGYILSGTDLLKEKSFHTVWKLKRDPFMAETSIPGIFAAGDVRFGALTGISSAVGEGSMAIRFVRKYLQEI